MNLDSVVSPQVLNKYLILVAVKSGRFKYQSGRAGDEAKKQSLPPKAGDLASMLRPGIKRSSLDSYITKYSHSTPGYITQYNLTRLARMDNGNMSKS